VGEALNRAVKRLKQKGAETPRLDAEVLLAHVLEQERVYLYRESLRLLDQVSASRYNQLLMRRAAGEPVAYLTGHKEFMGFDFLVGPHVLIPRPETELLVEQALDLLHQWPDPAPVVVDVGTGSGAVAVSLARLAPDCVVYATDISAAALALARENSGRQGVTLHFAQGDLLAPLGEMLRPGTAALIAANLPYIPAGELPGLPRPVRDFEPRLALDGGPDGLDLYRRLAPQALALLAGGGHLLMEISPAQSGAMRRLLDEALWETDILKDLAGMPRLTVARKRRGAPE